MSRWLWFFLCTVLGLAMAACGLLIPAHLRAVETDLLLEAGKGTPTVVDQGLKFAKDNKLGPAEVLLQAAQQERLSEREELQYVVGNLAKLHPRWQVWGGPEPRFESIFEPDKRLPESGSENLTEYLIRQPNRERVLALLRGSARPAVQALVQCRDLTNTVLLPPSSSSSGQAFDAAVGMCGLLLEGDHLAAGLSNSVYVLARNATQGGPTQPLEQVLLDVLSLGQRFNWGQLTTLAGRVEDPESLRLLVHLVRQSGNQMPVLYAGVLLSGSGAAVANYLVSHAQTGMKDLGAALRFGAGGLNEMLKRNQQLYTGPWPRHLVVACCLQMPWLALATKWALYLAGGFLLAAALHFGQRKVSPLEEPLQVRGFHLARELLFGLGFLAVVLLLSEPYLSQEAQRLEFPVRMKLPGVGSLVPAAAMNHHVNSTFMNKLSLLTLLLFFVLQALLYTACLVKLAEIRRQRVVPRIKLRLLENEDHLFDAGLYLGFVGTIISLILVSLGVIKPSLMAAYSSTSFGIIFVSIFKIFHLRPVRRKLLLEAEAMSSEPVAQGLAPRLVTP